MSTAPSIFDNRAVRHSRTRAVRTLPDHDFLINEVAERLLDRLDDITRVFPVALDMGCRTGTLARLLQARGGIETLVQTDPAAAMAAQAPGLRVVADEAFSPFADASFDAVLTNLALHRVNDLPGALIQARRALKPDGVFLGSVFGGATLFELRSALTDAELEIEGGVSPRVAPFADVRDLGNLLVRAGLTLPVSDTDTITVSYADPLRLMADLRGMGENNVLSDRRKTFSRRATLTRALEIYRERFADDDGRVSATFEIVYLTAWAPAQ